MYRKQVSIDGEPYIRSGQGFLIVYAIPNRRSFEELSEFREAILRVKDTDKFPMILVGNKSDLESLREVSTTEARELAKSYDCPFEEASAKTRDHVDDCFFELVKQVKLYEATSPSPGSGSGKKGGKKKKPKKKDCVIV